MENIEFLQVLVVRLITGTIFVGYFIGGVLLFRQVGTLCKMLGTNLAPLLNVIALLHMVMIAACGFFIFALI